jgi:hypothetical protein
MPLQGLTAVASETSGQVEVAAEPLFDGDYAIHVSPSNMLPPGPFTFDAILRPRLKSGELVPPIVVPLRGEVLEYIQPAPRDLLLGPRTIGQVAEESIVLFSAQAEYEIQGMEFDPVFGTEIRPSNIGAKNEFVVQQRILHRGMQESLIRFQIKVDQKTTLTVPLRISYGHPGLATEKSRVPSWTIKSGSIQTSVEK